MATFDFPLRGFFEWLWAASWQVSVLILAILFTQWALRKYLSPRTRYALWLLVLVRLALPTLPESPFSLFNLIPQPESVVANVSRNWNEVRAPASTTLDSESLAAKGEAPSAPPASSVQPESQASHTPPQVTGVTVAMPDQSDWPSVLAILWSIGALVFAAFLVGQSLTTRSWYKRLATRTDPDLENLLEECKRQVGIATPIRLAQAPERTSPALMGYWRPTLLLPEGIVGAIGRENLRYVFTHELAHLKRRDILANWIASLFRLLHWFNPVVWYAFRRMRTDQELACDHQALAYLGQEEKKRYSETILALFERVVLPQRLPGMAGIVEDQSLMKRRIQMIIDFKKPGPVWTAVTVAVAVALGLSALTGATTEETTRVAIPNDSLLSFPTDRSLGNLFVQDIGGEKVWDLLGEAKGEILIPENKRLALEVAHDAGGDLSPLSFLAPDDLYKLSFEAVNVSSSQLMHISHLSGLRVLNLRRSSVGDSGFENLKSLKALEEIYLYGSGVTSKGLRILEHLKNLRILNLHKVKIGDDGLVEVGKAQSVQELDIESTDITDDGLKHISGLPNLRKLTLSRNESLTDAGLTNLISLAHLEYLDLYRNSIADEGCIHLGRIPSLKHIEFDGTNVGDAGMGALTDLPNLESLILDHTRLTDEGLAHVGQIKSLRSLRINATDVTDQGLAFLVGLENLEEIQACETQISDDGLNFLQRLPSLRRVRFWSTMVTENGLQNLAESNPSLSSNGLPPKVGVLFRPRGQRLGFPRRLSGKLIEMGFEVYAIVEIGTESLGELPEALSESGLTGRLVDGSDSEQLRRLDVIAAANAYDLPEEMVQSIADAVQSGVGFFSQAGFGSSRGGYTQSVQDLIGLEGATTFYGGDHLGCPVLTSHPILGVIAPGDTLWTDGQVGYSGVLQDGQVLLGVPAGVDQSFSPLFVRQHGEGRVVINQWWDSSVMTYPYDPIEFLGRCINWAAKRPVGAKWIFDLDET